MVKKMKKIFSFCLVSLCISGVLAEPVNVGGVNLLNLRGVNASERVDTVYGRLSTVLGQSIKEEDVAVSVVKGSYVVKVKDTVLVTVTSADSKVNKTSAKRLSALWANSLKKTLPEVCSLGK
jgi:hypothetical protein